MIVDGNRYHFLGIILADHKIVQLCLNLVGCRQMVDVKHCLVLLFLGLFLLELLAVGNSPVSL